MEEKVIKMDNAEENKDCAQPNKTKSNLFMLEEMVDSMKESCENAKTIANEQQLLVDAMNSIKEKADNEVKTEDTAPYLKHDWEAFINGVNSTKELTLENAEKLELRIEMLAEAISAAKSDDTIKKVVEQLLNGLGVFSR